MTDRRRQNHKSGETGRGLKRINKHTAIATTIVPMINPDAQQSNQTNYFNIINSHIHLSHNMHHSLISVDD